MIDHSTETQKPKEGGGGGQKLRLVMKTQRKFERAPDKPHRGGQRIKGTKSRVIFRHQVAQH